MSFTTSNIAAMTAALKQGAGALLAPQRVMPYERAETVVKLHVGQRRAASPDLTAGAATENQYATIDADDWDAKVGRKPQKGDQLEWVGQKFAIESVQVVAPGGDLAFYKCRLNG